MEFITLRTFPNAMKAHMLKSKLESEGISCFLFDENVVSLNPLYNLTVGGIKLKINSEDHERAEEIIAKLEFTPFTDEQGEILKCPNCQSVDLYTGFNSMKGLKGILTMIVSLLLAIFPFYTNTVYKCKNCGTEFKNSK